MITALQCFVLWVLALGWLWLTLVATVALAFGNFVVLWQSFEALGYESLPLAEIPFLGAFAVALGLGEAPLASLYALVLTGAMNLLMIATAKILGSLIQTLFDWRQMLRAPEPEIRARAPECGAKLIETAAWLAVLGTLAFLAARWDVAQFEFRQVALATGLVDPEEALAWLPDRAALVGSFLADLVARATWGYVACVAGVALVLEHGFVRAGERWRALTRAIEQAVGGEGQPETRRSPATRTQATLAGPIAAGGQGQAESDAVSRPGSSTAGPRPVSDRVPPAERVPAPSPAESPITPPPRSGGPEVDVIVGPGEIRRVPLAEIDANPDRYVRDTSGRQWFLRQYYEDVMGAPETVTEDAR
jgi:hypothetical protein